ncbi:helitron_like_N domain-containing protein [Trichonephila clavipes]|nr:helitron_like_N domain-containing protein [Trichonephila clavipes]
MQIHRLRYVDSYDIMGQVLNVPVDVGTMEQHLQHQLDADHAFNVNIKKNMIHKSTYLISVVKKSVAANDIGDDPIEHLQRSTEVGGSACKASTLCIGMKNIVLTLLRRPTFNTVEHYLQRVCQRTIVSFDILRYWQAVQLGCVRFTPFMIATSDIRRDHRGVTS